MIASTGTPRRYPCASLAKPCPVAPAKGCHCKRFAAAEPLPGQQVLGPWPGQCWQRLAAISWPLDQIGLIVGRDRFGEVRHGIGHLLPLGLGRVLAPAQETVAF